jgi:hypothetical protein
METQNVSAQLYQKQLPSSDIVFNCETDYTVPFLQICDDPDVSDAKLEGTFQQQLDLSEYYKSPIVFNAMKKDYYDKTMEAEESPTPIIPVTPILVTDQEVLEPSGPTDFLVNSINNFKIVKESFGSSSSSASKNTKLKWILAVLAIISLILIFFLIK